MKSKILTIFLFAACLAIAFFTACEDDLVSAEHVYTEDELRYRDSIEAARAGVKADFIIEEDVELLYGQWSGVSVVPDFAVICEKLGYADAEAFRTGFGAFNGEVKLYAIIPATGMDFSDYIIDDAGVQQGFTFSIAGEPGAVWDTDQLYNLWAVYNINDMLFTIGMRTGIVEAGETYRLILLLKKGDYRLAIIYNVSVVEPEEENPNAYVADATIVQNVILVSPGTESNASVVASLNGALLASNLGYTNAGALSTALGSLLWSTQIDNEVTFFGVNASTGIDYTDAYTAGMGYWFTSAGDICSYSETDAALYVDLNPASLQVTIGQKGGQVNNGDTYQLIVMFANADNYRVAVELNVTTIVDEAPAGDPYELSLTQTVVHKITTGWEQDFIDVTDVMREAFKMTTAEIIAAINDQTMTFYALPGNEPSTDYPGHWFYSNNGTVGTNWQNGDFFLQINTELENLRFMLLNTSNHNISPTEVTVKQTAELNGGKVNFTFNVKLVSGDIASHEADYISSVKVLKNNDYSTKAFDITSVITAAFQKTPGEIAAAISDQTLEFYALNSSSGHIASTANFPGHWFDASGNTTAWGATAVLFAEVRSENEKIALHIGNFPDCVPATVTFRQVAKLNGGQVNLEITVDLVDP